LNNVDVESLFYEMEPSNRDVSGACGCAVVAEGFFPELSHSICAGRIVKPSNIEEARITASPGDESDAGCGE
jgi:hypothetical protein